MNKLFSSFTVWALLLVVACLCFVGVGPVMAAEAPQSVSLFDLLPLIGLAGTIDMFDRRSLLETVSQLLPPSTFLVDKFFPLSDQSDTESVDIDIIRGKRRMAPFVSPLAEGKVMDSLGFTTNTIKPGYLKPKKVTTAQDLLKRAAGEHIYSGKTPQELAEEKLAKDFVELTQAITRRQEWMAAQALNAGTVTVTIKGDGGPDKTYVIDFQMPAANKITLSGTDLWTDQSNSNPLEDLTDWARIIRQASGINPTDLILGTTAAKAFVDHPKVKTWLDTKRIDGSLFNPTTTPDGATWIGTLRYPSVNVEVWSYDEWYVDDSGTEQPMVPLNKAWLGSSRAQNTKLNAAIQDVEAAEAGMFAMNIYPKSWITKDPGVRWLMLQSAPVMALNQSDAFLSAVVTA